MTPDPGIRHLLDDLYLDLLGGNFSHPEVAPVKREALLARIRQALGLATAENLAPFLSEGWRERAAACWLLGFARWQTTQAPVGELLLASSFPHVGPCAAFALLRFDTEASSATFCAYLDTYLPRIDLDYDQDYVLAALVHIDRSRGTRHATPYLVEGGPWQGFVAGRERMEARLQARVVWFEQLLSYCEKHIDSRDRN